MRHVVRGGGALAVPELAHSVHVEVGGLDPRREYFFQFKYRDELSPVGRTLTAPARGTSLGSLAFAFASCQRWDEGYYSAYRRLAEEDLAFVVHLGDYFYEYGIDEHGGFRKRARAGPVPPGMRDARALPGVALQRGREREAVQAGRRGRGGDAALVEGGQAGRLRPRPAQLAR